MQRLFPPLPDGLMHGNTPLNKECAIYSLAKLALEDACGLVAKRNGQATLAHTSLARMNVYASSLCFLNWSWCEKTLISIISIPFVFHQVLTRTGIMYGREQCIGKVCGKLYGKSQAVGHGTCKVLLEVLMCNILLSLWWVKKIVLMLEGVASLFVCLPSYFSHFYIMINCQLSFFWPSCSRSFVGPSCE